MTTWTYYPCPKCGATDRVCEVDGGCRPEDLARIAVLPRCGGKPDHHLSIDTYHLARIITTKGDSCLLHWYQS